MKKLPITPIEIANTNRIYFMYCFLFLYLFCFFHGLIAPPGFYRDRNEILINGKN